MTSSLSKLESDSSSSSGDDNNSETIFYFFPLVFLAGPLVLPVVLTVVPANVLGTTTLCFTAGVVLSSLNVETTVALVAAGVGLGTVASRVVTGMAAGHAILFKLVDTFVCSFSLQPLHS